MRIRLRLLLFSFFVFYSAFAYGQETKPAAKMRELYGNVKNQHGEIVPGASVYIKSNPRLGVSTDAKGDFFLKNIPAGKQIIMISNLGMVTQEIPFTYQDGLSVVLKEDVSKIQDVVVTGIYNRHKNSFAGSATTYSKKDLKMVGTKNLIQSLKTLEPSMIVAESKEWGSDPNRMPDMEIRGKTSLVGDLATEYDNTANQPLFILDGIEVEIQQVMNLNMDRIQSVTVLKDAASTAIYGSKSSNGVIVVETVRPQPGQLRVSYNADVRIESPILSDYNLMNSSEKLKFELLSGRYTSSTDQDQLDDLYYSRLAEVKRGVDSYWLSEPLRAVANHSHNIYIDGGDQSMIYGLGLNYSNMNGVMKGSDRDVVGGNINLVYRRGSLIFSNDFNFDAVTAAREPVAFSTFAKANPYYRMTSEDGTIPQFLESYEIAKELIVNPMYVLRNVVNTDKTSDIALRNNFRIDWRVLKFLQVKGRFGISKSISKGEAFKSPKHTDFNGEVLKGSYTENRDESMSYTGDFTVSFGKIMGEHHQVNAVAGWSFNSRDKQNSGYSIYGFTNDLHQNPQFSSGFQDGDKPNYSYELSRSTSFYANGNYSFKNRYMLDVSLRMDGSSVFGAKEMFTNTWAFGLGWNIHNEEWCKAEWLNLLKIRVSMGNPGNQNFNAYMASGTYKYNPIYQNMFGSSAIIEKFANLGLKWQKTIDKNVGIDFDIFDRLKFSVDVYNKNTDPLLAVVPMPPSVGVTSIYTNFGGQISKGVSGSINGVIIKTKDIRWGINVSFSHGTSKFVNIGDKLEFMNEKGSARSFKRYYDGASADDIWAVRSHGIDPATGREVFIKKDGSYTFRFDADDEVVVGSSSPDVQGVIGTSFYYKGFSASVNFRYKIGAQVFASALYNKVENITESDLYYNLDRRALHDRWQKPGDVAKFRAINIDETTPMSSRFVMDENTLVGESISIGYETSGKWVRAIKANGMSFRVYMNDIFRLASFKEERGIDYPFSKSVTLSVGIRF